MILRDTNSKAETFQHSFSVLFNEFNPIKTFQNIQFNLKFCFNGNQLEIQSNLLTVSHLGVHTQMFTELQTLIQLLYIIYNVQMITFQTFSLQTLLFRTNFNCFYSKLWISSIIINSTRWQQNIKHPSVQNAFSHWFPVCFAGYL